jgi:hypothetical protein
MGVEQEDRDRKPLHPDPGPLIISGLPLVPTIHGTK